MSPEIGAWIDKHRTENQAWFSLATNLNLVAQQLRREVPSMMEHQSPPEVPSAFLSALLFMRGLSSFQAAILLAERGLIQDARTITRSCFETLFCFGALRNDSGFLEQFEKHDFYGKSTFANALPAGKLEPDVAEILSQFLERLVRSGEAAKKPRTECCCQPVAFMMAAIVVPFGCLSRARTASCLVPPRVEPGGTVLGLTSPFARLLARENSVFPEVLLGDISRSFSVVTAPGAVTTEAPQWRHRQRGRIPDRPTGPLSRHGDSDAPIAPEVHFFL